MTCSEARDYFEIALAFLVATIVMALFVFSWLPQDSIFIGFVGGDGIYLRRDWLVRILLLLPFSLFLGFAIVGALKALKKYLFETR